MTATRPRRRAPDERREQLLDAAERVLIDRGLAATTIADVAEAADVAKGTLYLYFDSKDALLAGLRARYFARFTSAVGASVAGSGTAPRKRLERFVTGLFEFFVENQQLHHLLFHQAGFSEDDAFAGARDVLEALIDEGIADETLHAKDTHVAASFVLHGLHGVLVDALHGDASSRRRYVAMARELAAGALRRA